MDYLHSLFKFDQKFDDPIHQTAHFSKILGCREFIVVLLVLVAFHSTILACHRGVVLLRIQQVDIMGLKLGTFSKNQWNHLPPVVLVRCIVDCIACWALVHRQVGSM